MNGNTEDTIKGIKLKIQSPYIWDYNKVKWWSLKSGIYLYCISIVVSDNGSQLQASMDIGSFSNVHKNEYVPYNKEIYTWSPSQDSDIPERLFVINVMLQALSYPKCYDDIMARLTEDGDYKRAMMMLSSVIPATASNSFIVNQALRLVNIMEGYLGRISSEPVSVIIHSCSKLECSFEKPGVSNIKRTTRNVDHYFELEIISKEAVNTPASCISGIYNV